ncbi:MAG: hypothetical protein SGI92_18400 [Bryobacteraceae bacterium]|nr:hypothetical protein [Bryobacteraceae bacterium]
MGNASPREQDYIRAVVVRYSADAKAELMEPQLRAAWSRADRPLALADLF